LASGNLTAAGKTPADVQKHSRGSFLDGANKKNAPVFLPERPRRGNNSSTFNTLKARACRRVARHSNGPAFTAKTVAAIVRKNAPTFGGKLDMSHVEAFKTRKA
jgi:hypothetical protein